MAKIYNTTKDISMLVCFAGSNRRIVINPKKCQVNRATKSFTYRTLYKADNGKTYLIDVKSDGGYKANVVVSSSNGKEVIAIRNSVDVRFGRYLFG